MAWKVFVVDDDRMLVEMLRIYLGQCGCEVAAESEDFRDVLSRIEAFSPDMVLLDIRLPGTDGVRILGEIKKKGTQAQVIMMSSDGSQQTKLRCAKLGAAAYVMKPFDLYQLELTLTYVAEKQGLKWQRGFYCSRQPAGSGESSGPDPQS